MSIQIIESKVVDRVPSTIQFPYSDLSDAIAVAEGLLRGGGMALSRDQLAAAMNASPTSGSFNTKVNTARIFGVMETGGGEYKLTDLGFEIVDPARQRDAMVTAFLTVPLYKKTYDEFRGKRLPPRPHGLERTFASFGVSPKQTKNARLAFEKSARLAGFYPGGDEDRLVMPFGMSLPVGELGGDGPTGDAIVGAPVSLPAAAAPVAAPAKALEYELVDLLKTEGIGEAESEAIWTLVRFLSARKKGS